MTDTIQEYIDSVYQVEHLTPLKKRLKDNEYIRCIMSEGCLLDNELWVHPSTIQAHLDNTPNHKYIYVFTEKYVNNWSSTQSKRKFKKLCKKHLTTLKRHGIL